MAVTVLLALVACGADYPTPVDRARRIVADDDRFDGGAEPAGDAFAEAGGVLLDAGTECEGETCSPILEASAYLQLVAVEVLDCRAPQIHDARQVVLDHLDALADAIHERTAPPSVPALPRCEAA